MDKAQRLDRLLRFGYFPAELPPPFTTSPFADFCKASAKHSSPSSKTIKTTLIEKYSQARPGIRRRGLGIPNPFHQLLLSKEIANTWTDIDDYYSGATLSKSRPYFDTHHWRAIKFTQHSELRRIRARLSAGYNYVLIADISRYFPSIYTHSIAWALHTKEVAKQKRNDTSFLGNRLDRLVQSAQDGQTIGVPIGTDSSRIIAELIGTALDKHLELRIRDLSGYRHVDDFYLYFQEYADAENALHVLMEAAKSYELDLNESKTSINRVEDYSEPDWLFELRKFQLSSSGSHQENAIEELFERCHTYNNHYGDDSIYKYGIRVSQNTMVTKKNWDLYEAYLIRAATVQPSCLDEVANTLISYEKRSYPLNKGRIKRFCNWMISRHSTLQNHSEVAWSLWLMRELKIGVLAESARALSNSNSSVCALLALDMKYRNLIRSGLDTKIWESSQSPEGLRNSNWLLSYEAQHKGWLTASKRYLDKTEFFEDLHKAGVYFYDENAQSIDVLLRKRRGRPSLEVPVSEYSDDYEDDEYDDSDYGDF